MKISYVISIFCLLLVSSCSKPKLESLVKDDSFTYDRMQLGHLLVTRPVVDSSSISNDLQKLSEADFRIMTGYSVEQVKSDERENLKVKPIYAHKRDSKEVKAAIEDVINQKNQAKKSIALLKKTFMKFPDPYRYILLINIMSEKKWEDKRIFTSNEKKPYYDKKGKKKYRVASFNNRNYYRYRKVDLNGLVLDLKYEMIVWDGLSSFTSTNANTNKTPIGRVNVNINTGDNYPAYPNLIAPIKGALGKLIINLPDQEGED